ncbi:hypothetical protein E2C01_065931 [Portunus trituberculatus]|uniref:Uncharacterized protein n=1 Tax=Portunus trituberculatus TaxID=210409 RepID=A0A5B7HR07_PORTR|nr:hypothetical protein [Portunus trituberculatus]
MGNFVFQRPLRVRTSYVLIPCTLCVPMSLSVTSLVTSLLRPVTPNVLRSWPPSLALPSQPLQETVDPAKHTGRLPTPALIYRLTLQLGTE